MPRPRAFATDAAVRAARDRFWEFGYEATSLADLERVTGLNRSSLYQAFGSKRELYDLALHSYLDEVAGPRLAPLEAPGAGPPDVVAYFTALAATVGRTPAPIARRGCLMVNTMTELGGRDDAARAAVTQYRARVARAFRHALRAGPVAASRAEVATGLVIGILATARIDQATAARTARGAAAHAAEWR